MPSLCYCISRFKDPINTMQTHRFEFKNPTSVVDKQMSELTARLPALRYRIKKVQSLTKMVQ